MKMVKAAWFLGNRSWHVFSEGLASGTEPGIEYEGGQMNNIFSWRGPYG
jgi:hypothetical protein